MSREPHLIVVRFSSLGDVAMTVPVIRLLLQQHPYLQLTMVSTPLVQPLFEGIDRLRFVAADLKGRHKGVKGLLRLYRDLGKSAQFTGMADLHEVLRTKILRSFFRLSGLPVAVLDKGRKEKAEMTRQHNKVLRPLKTTFQRYADVFKQLGYEVPLSTGNAYTNPVPDEELMQLKESGTRLIGIAPFAQFKEKVYPAEKMAEVIRLLSGDPSVRIFLFGGKEDVVALEALKESGSGVEVIAGKLKLGDELKRIAALDVMVSMDSANMHLASLFAVPVVSIWGGTHPWLGFYGWGQDPRNAVQIELDCRPSSVFGKKECPRRLACMHGISPLLIAEKVQQVLTSQKATS